MESMQGAGGFARPKARPLEGMKVAVFDLDDTLSDTAARRHLVDRPRGQRDWPAFYGACGQDPHREEFVRMARELRDLGVGLAFFTGRIQSCKADSLAWLAARGLEPVDFRLRQPKSFLKSHQLKGFWLQDLRDKGAEVVCAFDDEDANIEAFKAAGVRVIDAKDEALAQTQFQALLAELGPAPRSGAAPAAP